MKNLSDTLKSSTPKDIAIKLVYSSVAVAGLVAAFVALFAGGGNIVGRLFATVAVILVADVFVLLALVATYTWLRNATWAAAIFSIIPSLLYTWTYRSYWNYYTDYDPVLMEHFTEPKIASISSDLMFLSYMVLVALGIACVVSLMSNVSKHNVVSLYSYYATIAGGLTASLFYGLAGGFLSNVDMIVRIGTFFMIIALTAFGVLLINVSVESVKRGREVKSNVRLPEGVLPYNPMNTNNPNYVAPNPRSAGAGHNPPVTHNNYNPVPSESPSNGTVPSESVSKGFYNSVGDVESRQAGLTPVPYPESVVSPDETDAHETESVRDGAVEDNTDTVDVPVAAVVADTVDNHVTVAPVVDSPADNGDALVEDKVSEPESVPVTAESVAVIESDTGDSDTESATVLETSEKAIPVDSGFVIGGNLYVRSVDAIPTDTTVVKDTDNDVK